MRHWLARYWPWVIPIAWLIGYEVWAALSRRRRTLSEIVWQGTRGAHWLPLIVLPIIALLVLHLFGGLWQPEGQKPVDDPATDDAAPLPPPTPAPDFPNDEDT